MATNWSGRRVIGIMLLLTAGAFVLGMMALCVSWAILHLLGIAPSFWAMTEAVATAVTAATVTRRRHPRLPRAVRSQHDPTHRGGRPPLR